MTHGTCENCRWWDSSTQQRDAQPDTTGACRVHPPTVDERTCGAMWPFTDQSDWCGSFIPDTKA